MTSDVERAIDELQRSGRLQDVALYAFGHTAATEQMRRRLGLYDITLTGVFDNNPAKQGSSLHGVPVIAPDAIADASVPSVVLIASRFHSEMRRQLLNLGYAGEIIRVGTLSIEADTASGTDPDRGARLLGQLRIAHPDRHLVVCPFGALGDVYWALAYLPAFTAAGRPLPPVVVVVSVRGAGRSPGSSATGTCTASRRSRWTTLWGPSWMRERRMRRSPITTGRMATAPRSAPSINASWRLLTCTATWFTSCRPALNRAPPRGTCPRGPGPMPRRGQDRFPRAAVC